MLVPRLRAPSGDGLPGLLLSPQTASVTRRAWRLVTYSNLSVHRLLIIQSRGHRRRRLMGPRASSHVELAIGSRESRDMVAVLKKAKPRETKSPNAGE